jgi:hypothetical protein
VCAFLVFAAKPCLAIPLLSGVDRLCRLASPFLSTPTHLLFPPFQSAQLRDRGEVFPPEDGLNLAKKLKEMWCYVCPDLVPNRIAVLAIVLKRVVFRCVAFCCLLGFCCLLAVAALPLCVPVYLQYPSANRRLPTSSDDAPPPPFRALTHRCSTNRLLTPSSCSLLH